METWECTNEKMEALQKCYGNHATCESESLDDCANNCPYWLGNERNHEMG